MRPSKTRRVVPFTSHLLATRRAEESPPLRTPTSCKPRRPAAGSPAQHASANPTPKPTLTKQHKSQTSTSQSSIDATTSRQLDDIKANVAKHQKDVVAKIVERVLKCEPELHRNLNKVEAKA